MSVAITPPAISVVSAGRQLLGTISWRRNILLGFAVAVLLALILCALMPGVLAPMDPLAQNLRATNLGLNAVTEDGRHLLGTDALGRDVLSRLIYGARLSLGVGLAGALLSSAVGIPLGLIAGFKGGAFDTVIMRVVDAVLSFPSLVLYIFLSYVLGGGILNLIIVLSVLRWVNYVRVTRSIALTHRDLAFVKAARMVGCSDLRIMFRHVLPNIVSPLAVLTALEVAAVVLAESSLSFLGLGVPPETPSWGQMIAGGRDYLSSAPWLVVAPGIAIFLATFCLNVVASWAREVTSGSER